MGFVFANLDFLAYATLYFYTVNNSSDTARPQLYKPSGGLERAKHKHLFKKGAKTLTVTFPYAK